jgi:hypothetical protein
MLWFILFGLIATVWVCYFAIPDLGVIGGTVVSLLMGACHRSGPWTAWQSIR